jgi:hypothetical protein
MPVPQPDRPALRRVEQQIPQSFAGDLFGQQLGAIPRDRDIAALMGLRGRTRPADIRNQFMNEEAQLRERRRAEAEAYPDVFRQAKARAKKHAAAAR